MLKKKLTNFITNKLNWNINKLTNVKALGGLSNINYKATYDNTDYFIRLCNNNKFNINRETECIVVNEAVKLNLSPHLIFFDISTGNMVTEFIDGRMPTENESNSHPVISSTVSKLKKLHNLKCDKFFNPFDEIRNRLTICKNNSLPLPENLIILENYLSKIEVELSTSLNYALCHNDLNPSNILLTDKELFIIDYEYSAMNDIFFDLATISWLMKDSSRKLLLKEYFGYYDDNHNIKLTKYLFIVKILSATWGLIKSLEDNPTPYDYINAANIIFKELTHYLNTL